MTIRGKLRNPIFGDILKVVSRMIELILKSSFLLFENVVVLLLGESFEIQFSNIFKRILRRYFIDFEIGIFILFIKVFVLLLGAP